MASRTALCRVRVQCSSTTSEDTPGTSPQHSVRLLALHDCLDITLETRLQWAKAIANKFLDRQESDLCNGIRDWDLVLGSDGSVENVAHPSTTSTSTPLSTKKNEPDKVYPARFRLPEPIINRLGSSDEKTGRKELFALGSLFYELVSSRTPFHDLGDDENHDEEIQSRYATGAFPDDVWELRMGVSILGCWCPEFAKMVLASHKNDPSQTSVFSRAVSRTGNHIKTHPILFSFEVLGGIASIASIAAVPILGAVGFAATGPVAGSAAAAWQTSMGLVRAGSIFAWCQSAAMGGAAVGGIVATGLTGAGVAVGAGVAAAMDGVVDPEDVPSLKEIFSVAWRHETGEERDEAGHGFESLRENGNSKLRSL